MAPSQTLAYNTLDVFTTEPYAGNQLGLVHVPSNTTLSQHQKQLLAIEFNYSETVILHASTEPSVYTAQIFTPKSEIPFAGHPTIGTAVWIFENLEPNRDEIVMKLKAGDVTARFDRDTKVAKCLVPHDIRVHAGTASWERVAASQSALADASDEVKASRAAIVSGVRGMNWALVDLSLQPELLGKVVVTRDDIPRASDLDEGWPASLAGDVFYTITGETAERLTIRQRVMCIDLEDPATGSASSALAAYLALKRGGKGRSYSFEIDQGVEMGRASRIFVKVELGEDGKEVKEIELSGQAVEIMGGKLRAPA